MSDSNDSTATRFAPSRTISSIGFVVAVLLFGGLAIAGLNGRKQAVRRAMLNQIDVLRNDLIRNFADAHDVPTYFTTTAAVTNGSLIRQEWSAVDPVTRSNLTLRVTAFGEADDFEWRLSRSALALADGNFDDALKWATAADENQTGALTAQETNQTAQVLFVRGEAFYASGQIREALGLYEKMAQFKATHLFALARITDAQHALGNREGALKTANELARAQTERGDALLRIGKKEPALGRYTKAAAIREKLIPAQSDEAQFRELGAGYAKIGDVKLLLSLPDAAEDYSKRLSLELKLHESARDRSAPELAAALESVANAALVHGNVAVAAEGYEKAVEICRALSQEGTNPEIQKIAVANTHNNLGSSYLARQKFGAAQIEYETAAAMFVKLASSDQADIQPSMALVENNRGVLQRVEKQNDPAIRSFQTAIDFLTKTNAIRTNSDSREGLSVRVDVAYGYSDKGFEVLARARLAESPERTAIVLATSLKNLGYARLAAGQTKAALASFTRAVETYVNMFQNGRPKDLDLPFARALIALAWIQATAPDSSLRDGQLAQHYAYQACELSEWKLEPGLETLAAAYAEGQNFVDAVKCQQRAIELAPQRQQAELAARLELFKQGKPFHTAQ